MGKKKLKKKIRKLEEALAGVRERRDVWISCCHSLVFAPDSEDSKKIRSGLIAEREAELRLFFGTSDSSGSISNFVDE